MSITPKKILQKYWGFSSFREPQEEIITHILANKNAIALLPTGGGKSLCFQIPALASDGLCIVISPLIALMQDQVANLKEKGIKATTLPSGTSQNELINLFDNIKFGKTKLLYISPERLQSSFIQQKIKELNVNLIAIDEAHCISEWGHDFRPPYRKTSILKTFFPDVPIIALTATATAKVLQDISDNLHLENVTIFKKSFFKPQLNYTVLEVQDKLGKLIQVFSKFKQPAIIYVNRRSIAKEVADFLQAHHFKTSFYHAGLSKEEKKISFENWMSEKTPIMVATNAFGMGIDKANIGLVIHYNMPFTLENYVQETGRAGRDFNNAFAILFTNKNDRALFKTHISTGTPTLSEIKNIYKKLFQFFQIGLGEVKEESFSFNFQEFSNRYHFSYMKLETTLAILSNHGILEIEHGTRRKSTLQFIAHNKTVMAYSQQNSIVKNCITTILRTYGGLFENEVNIDEFQLAKKCNITSKQLVSILQQLDKDKLAVYKKKTADIQLRFLHPREDDRTINLYNKYIKQFLSQKKQKALDLTNYITNNQICRSIQLLHYFGEKNAKPCNNCDVCKKKTLSIKIDSSTIIKLLKQHKSLSSADITSLLSANENEILIHLRELLENGFVKISHQNKYTIL
ncbi:RecQ family ATP-dependent DNA helicase [Polaribacter sp.]|nr:RecQ family ATP-dependent DNA helicase [Polaribacter sp.]